MTTWQSIAEQPLSNYSSMSIGNTRPTTDKRMKKLSFGLTFIYRKNRTIQNTFHGFPLVKQYLKLYCDRITCVKTLHYSV